MNATAARTRKPAAPKLVYKPRLQVIDLDEGTFAVQSESDPSKRYITNGKTGTCNCPAALWNEGTLCKHGKVAMATWPHLLTFRAAQKEAARSASVPTPQPTLVAPIPITRPRTGASALLEAFGIDG